ncbi:MAG TPA: biopolymer transporter ExbD [Kofleriaceae bacterium]|nr:biopolymer transporter ExbD [Kofleriaceae bacterium]
MSRWFLVLVIGLSLPLAAASCARDKRPPPRDAAQGCRAAIEAVGEKGHASAALREALSCERMYRDKACSAAWSRLGEDASDAARHLATIEATCRRACIRDSGGAPLRGCVAPVERFGEDSAVARVIELDRAMLQHAGLAPAEAEALAMRTIILATATATAGGGLGSGSGAGSGAGSLTAIDPDDPDPYDPDDYPQPAMPDAAPGTLVVDVDLTTIRVYGDDVALEDLEAKVSTLRSNLGFTRAEVLSDPDVPYERLIRVLDAVRAGGVDDVTFSARP